MQKFHILYNADGSLSYFRAGCLLTAAVCMAAYALMPHGQQTDAEPAAQTAAAQTDESSNPLTEIFSSKEEEAQKQRLELRTLALRELDDGAHFLTTCGNINAGFEGCRFEFSPEVLAAYDATVDAADDGFASTLKAKGAQAEDLCTEFGINSEGAVYARDKYGKEQRSCLPESLTKPDLSALTRITDDLIPNAAPSGRQPVLLRTACKSAQSRQLDSQTTDNRNI